MYVNENSCFEQKITFGASLRGTFCIEAEIQSINNALRGDCFVPRNDVLTKIYYQPLLTQTF